MATKLKKQQKKEIIDLLYHIENQTYEFKNDIIEYCIKKNKNISEVLPKHELENQINSLNQSFDKILEPEKTNSLNKSEIEKSIDNSYTNQENDSNQESVNQNSSENNLEEIPQEIEDFHKEIDQIVSNVIEKEKNVPSQSKKENETIDIEGNEADIDLIDVFFENYDDIISNVNNLIREIKNGNSESKNIGLLKNHIHGLKGDSGMIHAQSVSNIFHEVETDLENFVKQIGQQDFNASKEIKDSENKISEAKNLLEDIRQKRNDAKNNDPKSSQSNEEERKVRVSAQTLDNVINELGQARVFSQNTFESYYKLDDKINDLSENISRLTKNIRELDNHAEMQMQSKRIQMEENGIDDSLELDRFNRFQELTRFILETLSDLQNLQEDISKNSLDQASYIHNQENLLNNVQNSLYLTRLVEFNTVQDFFYNTVQRTSDNVEKDVNLDIEGGNIKIDRVLLDKLTTPIEHIIRNSIIHGIELPEERKNKGKPSQGHIKINSSQSKGRVVVSIEDDGGGLDRKKILKKAIDNEIISPSVELSHQQIIELILMQGFSTASNVTEFAGRGVGMDAVKNEINGLGGRMEIESEKDKGMKITLDLPASISTITVLLVETEKQIWGIPVKNIDFVASVDQETMKKSYNEGLDASFYDENIDNDKKIPIHYFPHIIGFEEEIKFDRFNYVVVGHDNNQQVGFHVNKILDTKNIQLKSLDNSFSNISGMQGVTILPDGHIAYVVEPVRLLNNQFADFRKMGSYTRKSQQKSLVLVVDDSITIRKTCRKLLEQNNYDVIDAKNGEEALEKLYETTPDVILLDIEMPKMDGFEFTLKLKGNSNYKNLPIIMITSRTATKHKNYALSLGVDEYIGKPYKDAELLKLIKQYVSSDKN